MSINLFKCIIIFLLIIYDIKDLQEKNIKKQVNFNYNEKILNDKINFYRELLQLYIEDREKFYIKGREYLMKLGGRIYNDSNILTIQDKLNYLLIHESPENKTNIVDKILLRNYSKQILGKDICVPIIKVYNNVDEINLDELPDKFVLKCNHGSGMNIICKDKNKFNLTKAKENLMNWMKINYGLLKFEYQYINVKRKIFAEKYLVDNIIDYKFNCYNGEPKFIRVKNHIKGKNVNNIYDINWNLTNIDFNYTDFVRDPQVKNQKPINLDLMINYARLLSSNFCFCRVDFYEINGTVYLGELTFAPGNVEMKYNSIEMSIYLGNLLNISKIKNKENN